MVTQWPEPPLPSQEETLPTGPQCAGTQKVITVNTLHAPMWENSFFSTTNKIIFVILAKGGRAASDTSIPPHHPAAGPQPSLQTEWMTQPSCTKPSAALRPQATQERSMPPGGSHRRPPATAGTTPGRLCSPSFFSHGWQKTEIRGKLRISLCCLDAQPQLCSQLQGLLLRGPYGRQRALAISRAWGTRGEQGHSAGHCPLCRSQGHKQPGRSGFPAGRRPDYFCFLAID